MSVTCSFTVISVCYACALVVGVCLLLFVVVVVVCFSCFFFFFQAEDGIRDHCVTGVQTCALPISVITAAPVWAMLS